MQTFLPYANFADSAKCLDRQRLGKQRVECLQLLKAINFGGAWVNHPATKMWLGYSPLLAEYGIRICEEWIKRGYKDTCLAKIMEFSINDRPSIPNWIGNEEFHISHQSNLVRKKPEHYRQFFPTVPDNIPYIWPI